MTDTNFKMDTGDLSWLTELDEEQWKLLKKRYSELQKLNIDIMKKALEEFG